jgi:hypothetical protein
MRRVRVHDVDCAFSNHLPQPPRRSRIDLRRWTTVDDVEADFGGALRQRLATPRRDGRRVSTLGKLAREPQRLSFAAAPTTLGIDVQYAKSHGAQHPLSSASTQASREAETVVSPRLQ